MEALTGFLTNPLMAIAGLVLGTVPIIIHLLNRTFYKTQDWAAMEFLLRAEQKTRRRVRLENLLLMILRYLLLALLGLALAQPFLNEPALAFLGEQKKHLIIVLDNSYSMKKKAQGASGEENLYNAAKRQAVRILKNKFHPANGDKVSILTSSAYPTQIIGTPTQDRTRAIKLIKESTPSAFHGNLLDSLHLLDENLKRTRESKMNREVIWFTDFQKNTWYPDRSNARSEIRTNLKQIEEEVNQFVLVDVGNDRTANTGVVELSARDQFLVTDRPIKLSARVRNFSSIDQSRKLSLYRNDEKMETVSVNLQPGASVEKEFQPIRFDETGPHSIRAQLSTDLLPADNARYKATRIKKAIDVLVVDGEPGDQSANKRAESYFLQSALSPRKETSPYRVEVVTDYLFRDKSLDTFDLIVLANLSNLSASRRKDLRRFIKRGGGVLMFLGDQTTLKTFNESLYDIEKPFLPGRLVEVKKRSVEEGNLVRLRDLQLDHPALRFFQPYSDKLKSLMTHGWIQMDVPKNAVNVRVLARYNDENKSPAIVERSIRRGKLITVSTSADMDWNFWPNLQGYVMLVDQLSRYLLGQKIKSLNVMVGEELNLPISVYDSSKKFRIVEPDDQVSTKTPRPLRDGGYILTLKNLNKAGVYQIEKEDEESGPSEWELDNTVSANTVPQEGNIDRISKEKLKKVYPDFSFQSYQSKKEQDMDQSTSDLWQFFATVVLVFLGLESLLALKIDRGRQL